MHWAGKRGESDSAKQSAHRQIDLEYSFLESPIGEAQIIITSAKSTKKAIKASFFLEVLASISKPPHWKI